MKGQLTPAASAHLDMLRGCAAFAVLVSHWRYFTFLEWPQLEKKPAWLAPLYFVTGFGHQAVVVFFVLSGYLVGGVVIKSTRNQTWSWKRYGFDRITRLGIVLIPALLLCLLWDEISIHVFRAGWLQNGIANHSLTTFLGNCAFLQTIVVPSFGTNFPLWSLANEFWYYVMFPLLVMLWVEKRIGRRVVYLLLLVGVAYLTRQLILAQFAIWLMGTAIFYFPPKHRIGRSVTAIAVFLAFLAVLGDLILQRAGRIPIGVSDFILGIFFSIALYFLVHGTTTAGERYQKLAGFFAGSSYTLYLVHYPLLVLTLAMIGTQWQPDPRHLLMGIGILAVTYLYALGVAALFERRTNRIKQWLRPRLGLSPTS